MKTKKKCVLDIFTASNGKKLFTAILGTFLFISFGCKKKQ